MKVKNEYFSEFDLPLLQSAIELFPDLLSAVICAKLVRERIKYPIESAEILKELVPNDGVIQLGNQSVTLENIERFVPIKFFPIENENQLLQRLLIAFQIGHNSHYYDCMKDKEEIVEFQDDITILPSPMARPVIL